MAPLLLLWGGRPAAPNAAPLSSPAHSPLAYAFGRGRGAAPCAGCRLPPAGQPGRGGGGGAAREPPPGRLQQTRSVPLPSLSGQHCRRHWRCFGHGGRGPHTAPVRRRVPLPRVARASFWRAGAGSPASHDPGESGRWGARGRAACGSSCNPLGASLSLLGGGGVPSPPGGAESRRPRGPQAGGGAGVRGGGEGGPRRCSPPALPRGVALGPRRCHPLSPARPLGVYMCSRGCQAAGGRRARPDWLPVGQCGGGGGGRGLLAPVRSPAFPRLAPEWAASFAHSLVPPFVAGRQRVMRE